MSVLILLFRFKYLAHNFYYYQFHIYTLCLFCHIFQTYNLVLHTLKSRAFMRRLNDKVLIGIMQK